MSNIGWRTAGWAAVLGGVAVVAFLAGYVFAARVYEKAQGENALTQISNDVALAEQIRELRDNDAQVLLDGINMAQISIVRQYDKRLNEDVRLAKVKAATLSRLRREWLEHPEYWQTTLKGIARRSANPVGYQKFRDGLSRYLDDNAVSSTL